MSDLVKRLRKLAERERPYGSLPDTLDEAAARIERLEAALREIAKVTYGWEPGVWSDKEAYEYFASLFFGAQAKARAALKEKIDD